MMSRMSIVGVIAALVAAPTMAAAQELSLHGFADVSVKNDYITPRGLPVTTAGETVQAVDGLVLDQPLDPKGAVTDVSFIAGTFSDFNPGYDPQRNSESFNEFDWFIGANAKIGKDWHVGAQFVEFVSPQKAYESEKNIEFSASFDDSPYMPVVKIQPYVKLFYAVAGGSTVAVGQHGGTFDVEIGAVPTLDLKRYNLPLVLSAPSWVTVGPSDFWGGGGNGGVFSTGLRLSHPLPLPPSAGHWSIYGGYQFYHLINDRLVLAESLLDGHTDRNISLYMAGVTLGF
jgi:hypothetical protein